MLTQYSSCPCELSYQCFKLWQKRKLKFVLRDSHNAAQYADSLCDKEQKQVKGQNTVGNTTECTDTINAPHKRGMWSITSAVLSVSLCEHKGIFLTWSSTELQMLQWGLLAGGELTRVDVAQYLNLHPHSFASVSCHWHSKCVARRPVGARLCN